MPKQVLSSVQWLRAIAAMAVVAYHSAATIQIHGWKPGVVSHAAAWGWAGVDIFFFISGFVMVMTTGPGETGALLPRGNSLLPGLCESHLCTGFSRA
ncbi:acyltransferase family protein [Cupriavidus basilensis]